MALGELSRRWPAPVNGRGESKRWRDISRLYQEAVTRRPSERAAFLEHACRGDASLCSEIESLLQHASAAGGLLNEQAGAVAGRMMDGVVAEPLTVGGSAFIRCRSCSAAAEWARCIAPKVALKILPSAFTADVERLARFEREARMLAALNHPHIAAIYGIEDTLTVWAVRAVPPA